MKSTPEFPNMSKSMSSPAQNMIGLILLSRGARGTDWRHFRTSTPNISCAWFLPQTCLFNEPVTLIYAGWFMELLHMDPHLYTYFHFFKASSDLLETPKGYVYRRNLRSPLASPLCDSQQTNNVFNSICRPVCTVFLMLVPAVVIGSPRKPE